MTELGSRLSFSQQSIVNRHSMKLCLSFKLQKGCGLELDLSEEENIIIMLR